MTPHLPIATVVAALATTPAIAETITVCAKGCDYTSINAAIAVASDGDVIQLSAETYFEGEQIDTLGKAITLQGTKAMETVLSGQDSHRVLACTSGETSTTTFADLRIASGFASGPGHGGGLLLASSEPTFRRCVFQECRGIFGGAVHADRSGATFEDCRFVDNATTFFDWGYGGGIFSISSSLFIQGCFFERNQARSFGGGLHSVDGAGAISASFFNDNESFGSGGAISIFGSSPYVSGGFSGNVAGSLGPSIFVPDGHVDLWNSTFTGCCQVSPPMALPGDAGNRFSYFFGDFVEYEQCGGCREDLTCDGVVDGGDLALVLSTFGQSDVGVDFNEDGRVDAYDLGSLLSRWGPCD